ncbi:nitrate- and nitrite sensing domain-containing protein [Streptomyces noursei]
MRCRAVAMAVALPPLLVATGFAGLHLTDLYGDMEDLYSVEQAVGLGRTGSSLVKAIARERDLAIDPRAGSAEKGPGNGRAATDAEAALFREALERAPEGAAIEGMRTSTREPLNRLVRIRTLADSGGAPADVEAGYHAVMVSLAGLYKHVRGDEHTHAEGRSLFLLSVNGIMLTGQRSLLSAATTTGRLDSGSRHYLLASQQVREATGMEFETHAERAEAETFRAATRTEAAGALTHAVEVLGTASAPTVPAGTLPASWYQEMTGVSQRLESLQDHATAHFTATARHHADQAHDRILTHAAVSCAVLLGTALVTSVWSRRLARRP